MRVKVHVALRSRDYRLGILSCLLLFLSGCFASNAPLISPDMASFPAEVISYTETGGIGSLRKGALVREGDDYVDTVDGHPTATSNRVRLMKVGSDKFLA